VRTIVTMADLTEAIAAYQDRDYQTARRLYRELAEQGNAQAHYALGKMESFGLGADENSAEAFRHWKFAAEAGHVEAQFDLATAFARGWGVEKNYGEALRWYQKAAEGGDANALFRVGVMYANGEGVPVDFIQARHWWERAAAKGESEAMLFLARLFQHGDGCERDIPVSAEWYMRAWQAGNPDDGLEALVPELESLSDQGSAAAQHILGVVHKYALDNDTEAVRRLDQAARQHHPAAMRLLGYCYQNGEGVAEDVQKAAELYCEAATLGDKEAQFNLAIFYEDGLGGLSVDRDEAIAWYRKAADQGVAEAFQLLATLLAQRNRDRDDAREAIQRLAIAAANGPDDSEYHLTSGDGQWSVTMANGGTVVSLTGITLEELDQQPPSK
jgi:TPR repeat protein